MNKIKSSLILLLSIFLFAASPEDEGLYQLDLENLESYEVSCYEQLNTKWVVSNDSCCLLTAVINLPGNPDSDPLLDVPIDINIYKTGNLEDDDLARLEYRVNEFKWITMAELTGTEIPNSSHLFSYIAIGIDAGSDIEFRLTFITNAANEKLTLMSTPANNMVIGVPLITGTEERFEGGSLPVVLSKFAYENHQDYVLLEWTTSSEINNDFFEVQKSINGSDFDVMATIPGAGNSNEIIEYEWEDLLPYNGTVYYRLKQVDYDGQFEYSKLIAVTRNSSSIDCIVKVNPNPCLGSCRVVLENCNEMANENVNIQVFDALGNVVTTQSAMNNSDGDGLFSFNSSNNLAPGIYIVKASTYNKSAESRVILN
ncbi:MAG: T9SS type A sorting domain-containing protein [Bacteroidales bacterium]|nr:T9SS type A sorting domain-containing protein [Bacteroidales bacterium]